MDYISPKQLREIADACDALQPLWDLLTAGGGRSNDIEYDMGNDFPHIMCYGYGGENLGYISWGEDGPTFYLAGSGEDD